MIFMTDNEAKRQSICPIHTRRHSLCPLSLSLSHCPLLISLRLPIEPPAVTNVCDHQCSLQQAREREREIITILSLQLDKFKSAKSARP